jgi:hypothetical protein
MDKLKTLSLGALLGAVLALAGCNGDADVHGSVSIGVGYGYGYGYGYGGYPCCYGGYPPGVIVAPPPGSFPPSGNRPGTRPPSASPPIARPPASRPTPRPMPRGGMGGRR